MSKTFLMSLKCNNNVTHIIDTDWCHAVLSIDNDTDVKLLFLCFSAVTFLLLTLANCVRDKSFREKLAPISPKGLKFVAQTDFCVHR